MNNERRSKDGGRGDEKDEEIGSVRAREAVREVCREGNLLVFSHQLGHGGDVERMEGDAS